MAKRKNKSSKRIEQELQRHYVIAYYRRNPVSFVERELEVELHSWQKRLLKFIFSRGFKNARELLQDQKDSLCDQK